MRHWRSSLVLSLCLLAGSAGGRPAAAQSRPAGAQGSTAIGALSHVRPAPPGYEFPNGQTFVYAAEWRLWNAGTATLTINSNGTDTERVNGAADSAGVVAVLYRVHDRFQSVFDRRSFCSQTLTKHAEEGFHKRETLISFNYARKVSILDETNLKNGQTKHTENEIPNCVTDVMSGIFYVASFPLAVGATYNFPLNDGGKTVDVQATVEARETVQTPAGNFPALRVAPKAASGVLKDRGNVWIWYSDDGRHIPVQMRARMFWGTLTFRLQRIDKK